MTTPSNFGKGELTVSGPLGSYKFDVTDIELAVNSIQDLHRTMLDEFHRRCVQEYERLGWRMIAEGKLFSSGWSIGETIKWDGLKGVYQCWPIPPRATT